MRRVAPLLVAAFRRIVVATCLLAIVLPVGACQQPSPAEPKPAAPNLAEPTGPAQHRQAARPAPKLPAPLTPGPPSPPAARMEVLAPPPEPIAAEAATAEATPSPVILRPPPGMRQKVRVGLLLPLSGPEAAVGRSMLDAAQLAVFDVAEHDFVLLPRDTTGTPEGAREAAVAALEDGAKLLLGPLFSSSVAAVAPLAQAAHINVVGFSNDRTVAAPGIFLIGVLPRTQIHRVVAYAGTQGIKRYAALVPDTAYGRRVADDLSTAAARFGGVLVQVEFYGAGQKDATRAVRRLASYAARREALLRQRDTLVGATDEVSRQALRRIEGLPTLGKLGFDAVLLPESGAPLKAIAALLPFYDIDLGKIRLLGMADWHETGLGREPALTRAWFAGPPPDARIEFEVRYRRMYRKAPHPLAVLAYDATALAAVLAAAEGKLDFSVKALTAQNGFSGMAGIFRLGANGLVRRGLAVMQVEPNSVRVISPPPEFFEDLSN